MSVTLKCPKHPTYQAIRPSKGGAAGCRACYELYTMVSGRYGLKRG